MAVLHVPEKLREGGKLYVSETKEQALTRLHGARMGDMVIFHEDFNDGKPHVVHIRASMIQMIEGE